MNMSIGARWEGLRLVQPQQAKPAALRATIQASLAAGGDGTEEELDALLDATEARLVAEGF